MVVGIAETAEIDPLEENWSCSAFFPGDPTHHICRGFVWEGGVMKPLPTLGGHHGFATGANNRGEVVGWAENLVEDATCNLPQRLQFRAVIWDTTTGGVNELPPLPGDKTTRPSTSGPWADPTMCTRFAGPSRAGSSLSET